jgi:hypothetical protein
LIAVAKLNWLKKTSCKNMLGLSQAKQHLCQVEGNTSLRYSMANGKRTGIGNVPVALIRQLVTGVTGGDGLEFQQCQVPYFDY